MYIYIYIENVRVSWHFDLEKYTLFKKILHYHCIAQSKLWICPLLRVVLLWLCLHRYPYVFGEFFCRLTGFAQETSANATVLTITAFTVERYVAICHPFLTYTVSKLSRAVKYIVAIWILALFLAMPQVPTTLYALN